jgi:phenylacetic acid degradation operon negative regulatory protein
MSPDRAAQKLVEEFRSRPTLRAGSLITTVFGDSIAPRGGVVWLGSLIHVLAPFGISERLVRTSVHRLVKDGWLESEQSGRRSYYRLTETGRERFAQATHRIYGDPVREWDGEWCLLLLAGLEGSVRDSVRREAGWLGFTALSPNVLAHPTPDLADLDLTLERLAIAEDVVVMRAQVMHDDAALRRLAQSGWNLGEVDARYARFVGRFRPVLQALDKAGQVPPEVAFVLRTLLIHYYRKILLRDPHLPAALLPGDWHGAAAYQLCRNIYRAVYAPAEDDLGLAVENAHGALPPAGRGAQSRFGGLHDIAVSIAR